ncbi:MAG: chemotaxis-specific protein-glutamate methyltransferase CheB [Gemmataceae bacterium]|nr:chemotaxis-specific protein-glutamate methyltransferase CheB [Gemmataceae bacterium]
MRIGIVNDLALAQAVLRRVVESVPGYSVAWSALDGAEAIRKAAADRPDAILMDLIMPGVDGVEATRQIMAKSPCPILIVTASVGANFGKVYEALGAGGLDAVKTPTFGPDGQMRGHQPLLDRLAKLGRQKQPSPPGAAFSSSAASGPDVGRLPELLVIGASTGGPDAVSRVLQTLAPAPKLAVAVVQHIGPDFAGGFVTWLARRTGLTTQAAVAGEAPMAGQVVVAVSDNHLVLRPDRRWEYSVEPAEYPYRPSVDVLFGSVAAHWPRPGVAVLLTGMGSDGARGLLNLRQRGWHTIAQNEATSVVYGMPKAAAELGAAVQVLPLDEIGPAIRTRVAGR